MRKYFYNNKSNIYARIRARLFEKRDYENIADLVVIINKIIEKSYFRYYDEDGSGKYTFVSFKHESETEHFKYWVNKQIKLAFFGNTRKTCKNK